MSEDCAVILNDDYSILMELIGVRFCGKPGAVPMRLPSGRIVAWCCEEHRAVATA